ncbi:M20/M25/M40 family metallo-hydrolase [Mycolicibacterium novocastrense]|uniref:Glutamyl aminopeptidase, M42 family protein n=1 Tax=Mycolicibacterium novocastrense TaxID=59813 RepID=A0AAW5SQR0_MYCNV|nr:M20/M25/M40 family metallo-hydrolase [Mycolicibacterium novocastrense]MCV7025387.1 M20/M25/M40 family metallo-hydrolase [Mycolicibacterium novocastrense]GAT12644.1 glutamyl aminopeptidase, M42 family protein [Mycolicibacterium novocastrense]
MPDETLRRDLLQELLHAYCPCGQEDDVREVCRRELEPHVDEMWVDEAGNLIGLLRGEDREAQPARVMAHLDELSMLVKRIESDGTLHMTPLGTMYPGNFGLGPVALLGDQRTVCGVLTLGSEHTTKESQQIWETKPDQGDQALDWLHVYVFTGHTPEELAEAGIRAGTRACVHRSKRTLIDVGPDYLGCYFMDDRAAATALLDVAGRLAPSDGRPARDTYLVFTTAEEVGGVGGSYASRTLPGDLTLALEVGPTEAEYGTSCSGGPIVAYSDAETIYDKSVADALLEAATDLGLAPQPAVLGAFESDASHAKASGLTPRAGLLCLPTLSTHGYEVIARRAIPDMAAVLAEFLRRGV